MMYQKALCFHDKATAAQMLATDDVAKVKALGRRVSNYDESLWNGVRQIVVFEGLPAREAESNRERNSGGVRGKRPHLGHRPIHEKSDAIGQGQVEWPKFARICADDGEGKAVRKTFD